MYATDFDLEAEEYVPTPMVLPAELASLDVQTTDEGSSDLGCTVITTLSQHDALPQLLAALKHSFKGSGKDASVHEASLPAVFRANKMPLDLEMHAVLCGINSHQACLLSPPLCTTLLQTMCTVCTLVKLLLQLLTSADLAIPDPDLMLVSQSASFMLALHERLRN